LGYSRARSGARGGGRWVEGRRGVREYSEVPTLRCLGGWVRISGLCVSGTVAVVSCERCGWCV
jgi:hypothetical protein